MSILFDEKISDDKEEKNDNLTVSSDNSKSNNKWVKLHLLPQKK